jgi:hypothetical protein
MALLLLSNSSREARLRGGGREGRRCGRHLGRRRRLSGALINFRYLATALWSTDETLQHI